MYEYADDISYAVGGGGGSGHGHSSRGDFFAIRLADNGNSSFPAFDWYELKGAIYRFGYYDCSKILEGGATDDFTEHYYCSSGVDLFRGCNESCYSQMKDLTAFNFTSSLFGREAETTTSQLFY